MRTLLLVPLAAALAAAGCRAAADSPEQTAIQVPKRDLTLQQADAPQLDIASPVELARAAPVNRAGRTSERRARRIPQASPTKHAASAESATTVVPAAASASSPEALPVTQAAYEAPDPNALAPGQTVTVLPASGGSSSGPGWTDQGPPDAQRGESHGTAIHGGGHGGSCGGRGGRHPGDGASPGLR